MSAKSTFKGAKKVNLPPAPPRPLDVIQKDYQQAAFDLGQIEYQIFASQTQAEDLKKRILALNQEAFTRKDLDAKAAAETPKTEEVPNEAAQS